MSDKYQLNYYVLQKAIQETIKDFGAGDWVGGRATLTNLVADENLFDILPEDDSVRTGLAQALVEMNAGATYDAALETLNAVAADVATRLPKFRILLTDETRDWTDEALKEKAGKIWGAYLYDENRGVHLADMSPSYELHYLYCTAENRLPDDMEEILTLSGGDRQDVSYGYCRSVDARDARFKYDCGQPSDPAADSYDAMVESEIEHYRCNICFDVPRQIKDSSAVAAPAPAALAQSNDSPSP